MRRALLTFVAAVVFCAAPPAKPTPAEFPDPPALQPQVRFWTRIYTEVGTDGALIHDAEHLDVVYERVDYPDDLSGRQVDARYEATKQKYRNILRTLASGKRTGLDREERRVLKLFPKGVSNGTLRAAAENVRLQRGQADRFREGLIRSGAFENHILQVLDRKRLPQDLVTLPHVESSYNPEAYSKVGAAGLWQFMPSTGRLFSLRVNNVLDERMDPFKATDAAADLLQENYDRLGTWPLALTAYNHGAGGIAKAVREVGTTDIARIVQRYRGKSFGFASRNFYTSFLAAREASQNAQRYFGPIRKQPPTEYRLVRLNKRFSVKTLQQLAGVDLETLEAHNLALRPRFWSGRSTAPGGVTVRVPKGRPPPDHVALARADGWQPKPASALRQVAASEPEPRPTAEEAPAPSAEAMAEAPARDVDTGAPAPEVVVGVAQPPEPPAAAARGRIIHVLRAGETVTALARRYEVSTEEILELNHVRNARSLRAGDRLRIPAAAPEPAEPPPSEAAPTPAEAPPSEAAPTPAEAPPSEAAPAPTEPAAQPAALALAEPSAEPMPTPTAEAIAAATSVTPPAPAEEPPSETPQPSPAGDAQGAETESDHLTEVVAALRAAEATRSPAAVVPVPADAPAPAAHEPDPVPLTTRETLDLARYRVGKGRTIVLQTDESLPQVAKWLGIGAAKLRRLNKLPRDARPEPGRKLRLDFSKVSAKKFEARRIAYHKSLRDEFFASYEVSGLEQRVVRKGDTLWSLTRGQPPVPTWLLDHYNPDLDLAALKYGKRITIPKVQKRES